ncbi:unnamed protein product [Scytosiphon promiscuus]
MVIPRPRRVMRKAKVCIAAAEKLSATRWAWCRRGASCRELGTTASIPPADSTSNNNNNQQQLQDPGTRKRGRGARGVAHSGVSALTSTYVLPPPSWSLADLNVTTDNDRGGEAARAVLSREEIMKLCALAHIELAPEGGGRDGSLDVTAVQKDVGAMLRCMQTMRRDNVDDGQHREGQGKEGEERYKQEEEEEEEEEEGPWGAAAPWSAPLQEDVVSDGGIQAQVLGSARQTEDGFFTAPKVV